MRPGTFKNVLHIPDINETLISGAKMCDMGMNVLLTPNHANVIHMKTGTLMIHAYRDGNLYKLWMDIQKPKHAKAT